MPTRRSPSWCRFTLVFWNLAIYTIHSWENEWWPYYYVHKSEVKLEFLKNAKTKDGFDTLDLVVGDAVSVDAANLYSVGDLKDYVRIDFDKADAWFEEDQRIYVHPKDPYKVNDRRCMQLTERRRAHLPMMIS